MSNSSRPAAIKPHFREHYKPFEGKIYLPRFSVKNGRKTPEALDYYRHLISRVDVTAFDYAGGGADARHARAADGSPHGADPSRRTGRGVVVGKEAPRPQAALPCRPSGIHSREGGT